MTDASDTPSRRSVGLALLLICALGLGLRVYHALVAVAVSPDSALFIEYAQRLAGDPLAALRHYAQHPLYPSLILLLHGPLAWLAGPEAGGWILAGRLASIAGSLGAILAVYGLTARLYDSRRGLIAAALLAVLPDACVFGADVLSDLPHLALYLAGLIALLAGLKKQHRGLVLAAGIAAALAFLTRPEGASVLLVALIAVLAQRRWPLKRRAGLAAGLLAVFFCLAGPYQLATGKLIQKKSLQEMFGFTAAAQSQLPTSATPSPDRSGLHPAQTDTQAGLATTLPIPINILRQWVRAGRVIYVLLAILGVAVARPRGLAGLVLGSAIGIHLALLYALEARFGYLDRRHALILATLSLPPAAAAVHWISARLSRRDGDAQRIWQGGITVGIVLVCVIGTSRWLLRPINPGDAHVAASGHWLADNTPPGTLVVGDSLLRRVALYANLPFAEWPWWQGEVRHLARFLADKSGSIFVVDVRHMTAAERNPVFFEDLDQQLGGQLELLHVEQAPPCTRPTEIRVYRYREAQATLSRSQTSTAVLIRSRARWISAVIAQCVLVSPTQYCTFSPQSSAAAAARAGHV